MSFENSPDTVTLPAPKNRDLYFQKQVTQDTIATLAKEILEINKADAHNAKIWATYGQKYVPPPIKLYIDSYGGSVYQGLGLIGVMKQSATPIHTYVIGVAMSCGFLIAIHGKKRFCYKHATYMYHQLSSGIWGKLADMQEDLTEAARLQKLIEDLTVEATFIPLPTLKDNFEHKRDWFMTASEALKQGAVDEIL